MTGEAKIAGAPHRVYAIRMGPVDLQPDFLPEFDEALYAEARIEVMFEELEFLDDFDRSSLIVIDSGSYLGHRLIMTQPDAD
ncbi:hypothetical protein ACELLULO517_28035 [Acidisoma cellulosilytica]|uniref:Uncharacterized protein n=1 Tax=Acidisoma cellulosilyticum TaxID=2802395 RepID=A0A963Z920_9PROT|nr:hypothetical protein [Acidisoma cellulosilyticum]MCB8884097.1 hypothetical protein [Acidisoma cellulosilyticum]